MLTAHGVPIAPETYYAALRRPRSARQDRDERVRLEIRRMHTDSGGRYGAACKIYHQLIREGRVGPGAGGLLPGGVALTA